MHMPSVITMANANKSAFIDGDSGGEAVTYTSGDGIETCSDIFSARIDN